MDDGTDSREVDQMHGFKGSFIWSASRICLHPSFTISNNMSISNLVAIVPPLWPFSWKHTLKKEGQMSWKGGGGMIGEGLVN
jgi:hypothetical protein